MVKKSHLARNERIVFSAHSHWKALVAPVLVTAITLALVVYLLLEVVPSPEEQAWQRWTVAAVGALLVLVLGLWPTLVWFTSTDTLTTKRLISQSGVFSRETKNIPVDRVHGVTYRRTVLDRVLGCGTVVVQTAGADSDVELHDVAHVERRVVQIQEIIVDEQGPAPEVPRPGTSSAPPTSDSGTAPPSPTDPTTGSSTPTPPPARDTGDPSPPTGHESR
ncbi:PH domain-containing protein [Actinotalea sp. K2]|uniref:PH domain-containing protein n=1 Tax=Actinotalea sp. K2 TaxID=2939438 RepID=UPI002017E4D4|nr:PH domain-containing protein [Actinotalea sp. K2]MCL3860224.1 PH domain-containing protein [Actinotalea sp. K2]